MRIAPESMLGGAQPADVQRPLVRLQGVSVRFGPAGALNELNLTVSAGERLALIGANGSGKSTLLRLIHGLIPPSKGDCWREPAHTQAMLFQRPHMLRASARSNVALALWLRGLRWTQAISRADRALLRVGLDAVASRSARALSGGQQQRLALARAWALQPHLLLLDEPTASLDAANREVVIGLIAEAKAAGSAIIGIFHDLEVRDRVADRLFEVLPIQDAA